MNHKRVYRVYRAERLQVRRRGRKRVTRAARLPFPAVTERLQRWSMDFMRDMLADGRGFRTLNIVDDASRECPAIEVDRSIPGARVVRVLDRLKRTWGLPQEIVIDNVLTAKSSEAGALHNNGAWLRAGTRQDGPAARSARS